MFCQGKVIVDCLHGGFISNSAYTSHHQGREESYIDGKLSDNLSIESFFLGGLAGVMLNVVVHEAVNNFSYENIRLEIAE